MSLDFLAETISDLNDGIITLATAQSRLNFDMSQRDNAPHIEDYMEMPRDPLDIIVAAERKAKLDDALVYLKEVLERDDWTMFVLVSQGYTDDDLAEYFGITKNGVAYRLERIREYADGMQGLLRIEPRQYTATTPKIKVRYPMDAAKAKKPCGIQEYLNEAGVPSVCTLCDRCNCNGGQ